MGNHEPQIEMCDIVGGPFHGGRLPIDRSLVNHPPYIRIESDTGGVRVSACYVVMPRCPMLVPAAESWDFASLPAVPAPSRSQQRHPLDRRDVP